MSCVKITDDYGFVIRLEAVERIGLTRDSLEKNIETERVRLRFMPTRCQRRIQ